MEKNKGLLNNLGKIIKDNIMKTIHAFINEDPVESEAPLQAAIASANNNGAEINSDDAAVLNSISDGLERQARMFEKDGVTSENIKPKKEILNNPIHRLGGSSVKENPDKHVDKEIEF